MSDDLEKGLSRWSRRKLAARSGKALPDEDIRQTEDSGKSDPPSGIAEEARATSAVESADPIPDLTPIEDLTAQSDYTQFLSKAVPETLRRAALRKLWTSDPVLANLDGLNDYDEDFNVIDQAITAAQSSYQPGRGYLDQIEEKIAKATKGEAPSQVDPSGIPEAPENTGEAELCQNVAPLNKGEDAPQQTGSCSDRQKDARSGDADEDKGDITAR